MTLLLSSSSSSISPPLSPPPPLIHAVSGAMGGAMALILLYPLERVRIEMQRQLVLTPPAQPCRSSTCSNNSTTNANDVETIVFTSSPIKERNSSNDMILGESWSFETVGIKNNASSCSDTNANNDSSDHFHDAVSEEIKQDQGDCLSQQLQQHPKLTVATCFRTLLQRQQQSNELYRGIAPVVTTLAISNFIFFYMNEYFKNRLQLVPSSSSTTTSPRSSVRTTTRNRSLLASCLAGICNVLLTNPLWVTNMRITTGEATYRHLLTEMMYTIRQHNNTIQHLWSGTIASLLLVSNPVIQFFVYEEIKTWLLWNNNNSRNIARVHNQRPSITPIQAFVIGAIAKTIATLLTYPIHVAQAILRMQEKNSNKNNNNQVHSAESNYDGTKKELYSGTRDCLVRLYQQNGIAALYTGIRAKLLQTVLTAAFTFLSYEQIVQVLHRTVQSIVVQ